MQKSINLSQSMGLVALGTLALLSVPFIAMQFTTEVQWGPADFLIMGALIFGTGMLLVLALTLGKGKHLAHRAGMVIIIGATFFMIWVNLAVGLIGAGPHAGNFLYLGVLAVLFVGVYRSNFSDARLEIAAIATAIAFMLVIAIALAAGMHRYPQSSVLEIVGVNIFMATPFLLAAGCFRYAAQREVTTSN